MRSLQATFAALLIAVPSLAWSVEPSAPAEGGSTTVETPGGKVVVEWREPRVVTVRKAVADEPAPVLPDPPSAEAVAETSTPRVADGVRLPVAHHPWARFAPGAWRTIKTTTESFDPAGKFVGRTETTQTETLVAVGAEDYTIETTTLVNVGGKQLRGATQQVTQRVLTDSLSPLVEAVRLMPASVKLDGRAIPCERWQLTLGEGAQRRIETLFYSADLSPHLLRREAIAADGTDESTEVSSTMAVVRVDVPVTIDSGIVPGSHTTIRTQAGANQVERTEVCTDAVPGGLVSATSTERDASGRRLRWTTVEVVESGQAGDEPKPRRRWRLFRRRSDG